MRSGLAQKWVDRFRILPVIIVDNDVLADWKERFEVFCPTFTTRRVVDENNRPFRKGESLKDQVVLSCNEFMVTVRIPLLELFKPYWIFLNGYQLSL
jgi:hypothetical protein